MWGLRYEPKEKNIYATAQYRVCRKDNLIDLSKAKVTFIDSKGNKITKAEYTGGEIEPGVQVQVKVGRDYRTVDASNYKVAYTNNVNKNKYVGSRTAFFGIIARDLKECITVDRISAINWNELINKLRYTVALLRGIWLLPV